MAYIKPLSPIKSGEDYIYPLTSYDQIIMADGSRWDGTTSPLSILAYECSVNLYANEWSATSPYSQTVAIDGFLKNDLVIADINLSGATSETASTIQEAWFLVDDTSKANGSITFICFNEKPEIDLTVNLLIIRQTQEGLTYAEEAEF